MKIKNKAFWTLVTALLAAVTVFLVIRSSGMTFAQLLDAFRHASLSWLIPGILSMLGIIFFEGEAVLVILSRAGYRRSHRKGFVYSAADVYFSAITPSATGGQPASAFFMIKDGVPTMVTAATLLLNLVLYNAAILTIGIFCLLIRPQLFWHYQPGCRLLIVLGILVLTGMGIVFFLLLWHQKALHRIAEKLIAFLTKIHLLRHPDRWEKRLDKAMYEYHECVALLAGSKKMWIMAYLCNLLQRISQFTVSSFSYLSLGGEKKKLLDLWVTQCFVSLGSNCVPIPGSMGVTDYLMIDGYMNLMSKDMAYTLQVLARGLAFYGSVIISGITVLIAYFRIRQKAHSKSSAGKHHS